MELISVGYPLLVLIGVILQEQYLVMLLVALISQHA